jgi:hypothetical protein
MNLVLELVRQASSQFWNPLVTEGPNIELNPLILYEYIPWEVPSIVFFFYYFGYTVFISKRQFHKPSIQIFGLTN